MNARTYAGKLFYGKSNDHLEVQAFIVREREVAFSLASVSAEHQRWQAESGVVAKQREDGAFVAEHVNATQQGVGLASPWKIVFLLVAESLGSHIEIEGEIFDSGVPYYFSGELECVQK